MSNGLAGDAAIYVVAATVNAAIPFLLLPLIARWLGPSDFGVIGSFVAIVNVLILLVGLNAYGFVSVGYFRDGAHQLPRLVGAAVTVILFASAAIGSFGWFAADAIERISQIDKSWLWTLLAAAAGQALIAVGLAVAQVIRKPLIYGVLQISYGMLLGLLALILVGGFSMSWPGRALAQAIAALVVAIGGLIWLGRTGRITPVVKDETLKRVLLFGVPLLPHSLAAVAMGSMDRLALGNNFPPEVVGHYFLALQLASAIIAFAAAVNQAWVPWLYERLTKNDEISWIEISRTVRSGCILLVLGVASMAILATPLVLLVGGEAYLPGTATLRILACYAGFQAWYTIMSAFLFYFDRIKVLSTLTVLTAILQGALIAVLVPWGSKGIGAALLTSAFVSAVIMTIVVRYFAVRHRSTSTFASDE